MFVALATGLSWVPWLAVVATGGDPAVPSTAMALWMLGGLGPALAAFAVTFTRQGTDGVAKIVAGLRRWRLGRWYWLLLAPLPVGAVAVAGAIATGPARLDLSALGQWYLLPAFFLWAVAFGGLEEVGWRGYMLPRLQDRLAALPASLLVGVVWVGWHAPLFLMTGTSQTSASVAWFAVQGIALSVLLSWAYNATGGSTLLVVLAHAAVTAWYSAILRWVAPDAVSSYLPFAAVALVACAGVVVRVHGPRDLAARPRQRWSAP